LRRISKMVAIKERTLTINDWATETRILEVPRNIVRTLDDCTLIVPPFPLDHGKLRIQDKRVEITCPFFHPSHIFEWLAGLANENPEEASAAVSAYLSGEKYRVELDHSYCEKDIIEVNVDVRLLLDLERPIDYIDTYVPH
jgi:hypothetical protein